MPISEATIDRARRHNRLAMEEVIAEAYPIVFRLSLSLTGRHGAAKQVLHEVMRRSLRVIPKWRRSTIPENWFYHHTVITAREAAVRATPIDSREDVLVRESPHSHDPGYIAFIRALRLLPAQQSEAFILHHGERLNTRLLGVAMDCSQDAAAKHLDAATASLAEIAGDQLTAHETALHDVHVKLRPPPSSIHPAARKFVNRHLRPRQIKRVVRLVTVVLLLALGLYAWAIRDRIRASLPSAATSQQSTIKAVGRPNDGKRNDRVASEGLEYMPNSSPKVRVADKAARIPAQSSEDLLRALESLAPDERARILAKLRSPPT